ncbi:HpcH/HpaI aldolase family protein [Jatrophihabitans fulvus]
MHELRRRFRSRLAEGRVVGTFVKLSEPDVIDLVAAAGFDFAVVDLEHSTLSPTDAVRLVGHAQAIGLPALVRVPDVDAPLVNRLLEAGAVGVQLSMLARQGQADALVAAARFAPAGRRSISLANRAAGYGSVTLASFLDAEADAPPLLVGQIESAATDPLPALVAAFDVCFVGTTDLTVDLGPGADVAAAVADVAVGAAEAGVVFGGWAPTRAAAPSLGLADARYLIVGSDLQLLAAGLRGAARPEGES